MSLSGAILGDIIGSRFEFQDEIPDWESCDFFHEDAVFSDDTVQSLAIGTAAITHKDYSKALYEICSKYIFVGYGGNFVKWLKEPSGTSNNSWCDGSAMRVSYLGMLADSLDEAEEMATESAVCTHNCDEGITGAKAIAGCTYLARTHASKDEIMKYALSLYPHDTNEYSPDRCLSDYRDGYKFEVRCSKTVPIAIRCFLESHDFQSCMRNVLYMNGDTDTLGAMAGSIAGSFYGFGEWDVEKIMRCYLDEELFEMWQYCENYFEKISTVRNR